MAIQLLALSVVAPWGQAIAEGRKRIEVRSWRPEVLPVRNLLIVENQRRLTETGDTDPDGRAVALVDVMEVHPWAPDEAEAACSTWEPGWWAWALENVRPITTPFPMLAARKLYMVEVDRRPTHAG